MAAGTRRAFAGLVLVLAYAAEARAAVVFITPDDNIQAAIDALQPGDTLVLAPGNYSVRPNNPGRIRIRNKDVYFDEPYKSYAREHDDPPMWIVMRAQDPNDRPAFGTNEYDNVINITRSSFVKLLGLDVTGVGGNDTLKINDSTDQHHIVVENCYFHDVLNVGLGAQQGAKKLTIRHNEIARTGTGGATGEIMYLGANDIVRVVNDSLIEFNYCHSTLTSSQGDGIEIKGGGARNVVRYNVLHDTKYPAIFSYGNDGPWSDRNIIYGNTVWRSGSGSIETRGNTEIYNNLIVNGYRGIAAQNNSVSPWFRQVKIYNNTVYLTSNAAAYFGSGFADDPSNAFYNNALYSASVSIPASSGADIRSNVTGNVAAATTAFVNPSTDPAVFDFYPKAGSALTGAAGGGAPGVDIDRVARASNATVGAYESVAGKSNALGLVDGFKTFVAVAIASPSRHERVEGVVTVTGTSTALSEIPVKRVEVSVNAGPWVTASGKASWSYTFDSSNATGGLVVVEARAIFDLDGSESYSRSASVQLFVVNEPATEITLDLRPVIEDSYVNQGSPGTNYGSATTLWDVRSSTSAQFLVLRVPELPEIPGDATITSARLFMRTNYAHTSSTFSRFHFLNRSWSESTVSYNTFSFPGDVGEEIDTFGYADHEGSWIVLEIRDYVNAVRGGEANHGMISQPNDYFNLRFHSMEDAHQVRRPFLRVTFQLDPQGADSSGNGGSGGCSGGGCMPDGGRGAMHLALLLAAILAVRLRHGKTAAAMSRR